MNSHENFAYTRPHPHSRTGVLLINLGTPESPSTGDVRKYLRQFLSDPRVLEMNPVARWLLLNVVILPTRPRKSAAAYRKIWTEDGSPLLRHTVALASEVQTRLGAVYSVEPAMRYGAPSIDDALERLIDAGVDHVIALPLFPQYSSAATSSAQSALLEALADWRDVPTVTTLGAFYDRPGFVDAFAEVAQTSIAEFRPDHVLFSYHGLPEAQVRESDATGLHCFADPHCCDRVGAANRDCYRAQCFATSRALASRLGIAPDGYSVSFQSRLGRAPWIKPYTDEIFADLVSTGVGRLAVLCPSFVADCLETLEEIGIRGREQWLAAGGKELLAVPCINDSPKWADAVAEWVRAAAGEVAGPNDPS